MNAERKCGRRVAARMTACALALTGMNMLAGCDDTPATNDTEVASSALSASARDAFGFESLANWTISSGTRTLGSPKTQGNTALRLQSPVNYTTITSRSLAMTAADIAPLTGPGAFVAVDMSLPTQQPNPFWFGATQMFVSCPARGVYNQYLGQTELTGKPLNQYTTYRFFVPDFVRNQLNGKDCTNFSVTLVINVPSSGTGLYLVDNMRFKTAADATSTGDHASVDLVANRTVTPPSSVSGTKTFAQGLVQVPESFHVSKGKSGSGRLTLSLGTSTTDRTTCTYRGATQGTSYEFGSCTRGERPGQLVLANSATLTIVSADASAGDTQVKAQLALNPTGDEIVSGLTPIPTFWGDTVEENDAIATAYFNRVGQSPVRGVTVSLPVATLVGADDGTVVHDGPPPDPNAPLMFGDSVNAEKSLGGKNVSVYWKVDGSFDAHDEGSHLITHIDMNDRVGGQIRDTKAEAFRARMVYDSDTGAVSPNGNTGGSASGRITFYLFGDEFQTVEMDQNPNRHTIFDRSANPSFPICAGGFCGTLGWHAHAGVDSESVATLEGLQFSLIPNVSFDGEVDIDVNAVVASAGVHTTVNLVDIELPTSMLLRWEIDTSRAGCGATLHTEFGADYTASHGAADVDLVVGVGVCSGPFQACLSHSWTIAHWGGWPVRTANLFTLDVEPLKIILPTSACEQPVSDLVTCGPTDGETIASGLQVGFGVIAEEPPPSVPPGTIPVPVPIPCNQVTWSTGDASDQVIEQSGTSRTCEAIILFGNPGPRTLRIDATNGTNTKSAFKPLTVIVPTAPNVYARIVTPPQGCLRTFDENAVVALRASAVDPSGQTPLTFTWEDVRTTLPTPIAIGTGQALSWVGPHPHNDSTVRLTVTNAGGSSTVATTPLFFDFVH